VALLGLDGHVVGVEVDIADGLPGYSLLGLPDAALSESRDRVRSAIVNCGEVWPNRKVTVSLSPAWLPKSGSSFDLAICISLLSAHETVPAEKIVAKLKYMKTNEPLKLVSVNPTDIIGSTELWVYNTKSRKLGKYVAAEYQTLSVKGTSIINFNENLSICKTLRKPEEKLKEFKAAGKVQLRKFLDDINATDTKMNGRLNEETILLKVA
jgi:predicted ATPase with chaperone activity